MGSVIGFIYYRYTWFFYELLNKYIKKLKKESVATIKLHKITLLIYNLLPHSSMH